MTRLLSYRISPHIPVLAAVLLTGGCFSEPDDTRPKAVDQYVGGVQALKRGDQTAALRQLEAAVQENPDLRMARTVLGKLYRDRGDYNGAARQYETLARLDPYTVSNQYYLGVSYQLLRRNNDALQAYLAGLMVDPNDFNCNMNAGTVLLASGDVDGAIKYLDKATQLQPKSAAAWSNLGVALDARGSYVLAETSYRKAISLEANTPSALQNLANNLLIQQKVGEATYLWEEIVKQKPTSFNRTRLAEAYTQGGDLLQAETIVRDILKADPRNIQALNARAKLLIKRYEFSGFVDETSRKAAVATINQSLALNGSQPALRDLLKQYGTALPLGR